MQVRNTRCHKKQQESDCVHLSVDLVAKSMAAKFLWLNSTCVDVQALHTSLSQGTLALQRGEHASAWRCLSLREAASPHEHAARLTVQAQGSVGGRAVKRSVNFTLIREKWVGFCCRADRSRSLSGALESWLLSGTQKVLKHRTQQTCADVMWKDGYWVQMCGGLASCWCPHGVFCQRSDRLGPELPLNTGDIF